MSLANAIKQISQDLNDSGYPVAVMFGTVTQLSPLEVIVDQRFKVDEESLIITERVTRYVVDLRHNHDTPDGPTSDALIPELVIREGLKVGDGVLLLRVQGGQRFVVLDKVVD